MKLQEHSAQICSSMTVGRAHHLPDVKPALPKSILKRRIRSPQPLAKLSAWQRLVKFAKSAASFPAIQRVRWQLRRATEPHHIKFQPAVQVVEFSRRLDGGCTMPGDGTTVTLGLGKAIAARTQPLAPQPDRDRVPTEDRYDRMWLPAPQRVRVLRKAMGDNCFYGAWQHHKKLTRSIVRERRETCQDLHTREYAYMPRSLAEAQDRAARIAIEATHTIASHAHPFGVEASTKTLLKRKRPSENVDTSSVAPKVLASPLRSSSRQCQRCLEPISAHSDGMQCLCLIASPQSPSKMRRQ